MSRKFYIETMGCQMNKSDTERLEGMFIELGYEKTDNHKDADFLIVSTCAIRQTSVDKAYSQLGVWGKRKKKNPDIKIGICGCAAELDKESLFKRMPYLDLIFGTHNIFKFPEFVKRVENGEKVCEITNIPYPEPEELKLNRANTVGAWIPIIEGCNNFCTYCVVPFTRGRERSRLPELIVKEVETAIKSGKKEITLLGQNVDSYGKDLHNPDITLANLLRKINAIEGKFRIRFVTSYPTDITDDLIEAVAQCDKVCEFFHIPMQSGNSRVLKAMNRRYDREQYFEIFKKIRNRFDEVEITSDFIAGFPGETEEEFLDTLSAIEELQIDYSNTAIYSPRPFTKAGKMTELFIPDKIKEERFKRLHEVNCKMTLLSNQKLVGKVYEVLCESQKEKKGRLMMNARTRTGKLVHFPSDKDLTGEFVNVKITKAQTWCLYAEQV
ncbi:MAG: tRNA (N6-isopentenyl adenosine(37)-C2)-methylthiotransferase MiaB [Candidatus Gastranaerophilales bacterium]|nr:tRNA (N6-isopentenyl adenosine(37)-C2)-methylthiotransferase MiaB [Candidatus Gastranaerophilales bacterium]